MTTEIQKTDNEPDSAFKTLILMRHAKSDWADATLSDHDRPLNRRGIGDAPAMARWLAGVNHVPDLILCSSAVRTRQTADAMREVWRSADSPLETSLETSLKTSLDIVDDLYLSTPGTIFDIIAHRPRNEDTVMVIAHNPGISQLTGLLSGEAIEMSTAAIAIFRLKLSRWSRLALDVDAVRTEFMWPKAL